MKNEDSFEGGTLRSYCFDMPGKIKGTKFVANYIINPFIYFPKTCCGIVPTTCSGTYFRTKKNGVLFRFRH